MASGNSLMAFFPGGHEPPASNFATFAVRNNHPCLDFDAATLEGTFFTGVVPSQYAGGGVTIDIHWIATTALTGDVVWGAAWEECDPNNNDLDSDTFGTESTATGTANGTAGKVTRTTVTITHANCGSPAAGDAFRIRVQRRAADGGDTMTGDAELVGIHIKET
jgi:hypothetical protein